jgi:hypothetical protein
MGWLFMSSLGRFRGPRASLDDQFTYACGTVRSTVLRSALVRMRTYYAAVEQSGPDMPRAVFAVVCLVRYNPRDAKGDVFGYKDMTEHMGPCESDCPAAILDLLTPTDADHALAWRARCRAAIAARADRPRLRNGATIVFEEPIAFTDGSAHARLTVVIEPGRPRAVRFRPAGGGGLYRIANLHQRSYRLESVA